jgi:hypothetical protein
MRLRIDFDEPVKLTLRYDEAVILQAYLSRELDTHAEARLKPTLEHAAELHALLALQQELIPRLIETGGPEGEAILAGALAHMMSRSK